MDSQERDSEWVKWKLNMGMKGSWVSGSLCDGAKEKMIVVETKLTEFDDEGTAYIIEMDVSWFW